MSAQEKKEYDIVFPQASIGEGSLGISLIPGLFFFSVFNAVGNTIAVSYTGKNCLCTSSQGH